MVSFSCEGCGDVLTKKKLDSHMNQCRGASFTCLDCMVHFWGTEYRSHTSCISEAQKYQGALYRPEKEKKGKNNNNGARKAYIEDAPEADSHNSHIAIVDAPPEAPMPPSAAPDYQEPVNVFDFYVGAETPNPSTINLAAIEQRRLEDAAPPTPSPAYANGSGAVVRFSQVEDEGSEELVQYGSGPVPTDVRTPAPKERKSKSKDKGLTSASKSDKKRKRLHVDTSATSSVDRDLEMTDAPPVLHSGLTGGLQKMMARDGAFPPSPDYSGDNVEASPGSPLKRSKRTKETKKHHSEGGFSNAIMQMITTTKKTSRKSSKEHKDKKERKHDEDRPRKQSRTKRRDADQKMIEYKSSADASQDPGQMVVFKASDGAEELAGMLLGFVSKGPGSERGVSMNKALKRYHRMRASSGLGAGKGAEEKELWKSLRMRKNDRGEIVLFF
ncbi:hypothetical protein V502_03038 [Pseudogymnoascus sp. VKM F-4520 (FW-2644)]|nr:hypothetical protein V502_03038 [Pseudogymnoascus sp. VKM F-4520 (FW-2644)]